MRPWCFGADDEEPKLAALCDDCAVSHPLWILREASEEAKRKAERKTRRRT